MGGAEGLAEPDFFRGGGTKTGGLSFSSIAFAGGGINMGAGNFSILDGTGTWKAGGGKYLILVSVGMLAVGLTKATTG